MVILNHGRLYTVNGARYNGEQIPGELDGWDALDLDPNSLTEQTYDLMSQRSNTLYHTYPPVIGAVDRQTDYAIGDGLYFRSTPDHETLGISVEEARDWGRRFQHLLNYEFTRLNFYQKMNTLFSGALSAGDALLYFVRDENGFDIIEYPGFTIDSTAEFDAPDSGGDSVHLGILHDAYYRRKGFVDRYGNIVYFRDENGRRNVVQYFVKKQPRQLRGWPLAYSVISLAKADSRHWGATLDTAILEGLFFGQTITENPGAAREALDDIVRGNTKNPVKRALESLGNLRRITPGNMVNFRTGGKMEFFDKKTPSATFGMFKEKILDFIGMATGTPPEVIASKYSTAFTAHKGAANDFQKSYMRKRYGFIDAVCYPAMREVAVNMIIDGVIEAPGFFDSDLWQRAYLSGIWLGPVPGYINPLQEISARAKAVENGFENRADAMFNITGADYEDAIREWHRQEALFAGTPEEQRAEALITELEKKNENQL